MGLRVTGLRVAGLRVAGLRVAGLRVSGLCRNNRAARLATLRGGRPAAVPSWVSRNGAEKAPGAGQCRGEHNKSKAVIRFGLIQTEAKFTFDLLGGIMGSLALAEDSALGKIL